MSQIDFSKAPLNATHFLRAGSPDDTAWFRYVDGSPFQWHDGEWQSIVCVPPLTEAIPAVDWSKAPEGTTHYGPARGAYTQGWFKLCGAGWMLAVECDTWEFCPSPPTSRIAMLIERPAPAAPEIDWSKGPADATHWAPATGPGDGPGLGYTESYFKVVGDQIFWAEWLNDWYWRDYTQRMKSERLAMFVGRSQFVMPAVDVVEPAAVDTDWSEAPEGATHHRKGYGDYGWYKYALEDYFFWVNGMWDLSVVSREVLLAELVARPVPYVVDWSHAPEGANAFAVGFWFKPNHKWHDGKWWYQDSEYGAHAYDYPDAQYRPAEPWSGEGRPPAGLVCEAEIYDGHGMLAWVEAKVIHHHPRHGGSAAIAHGSEELLAWASTFRPKRTPEQIIADREREERIKAAQVWLEGVAKEYVQEAADKCEDILMEAERKRVAP